MFLDTALVIICHFITTNVALLSKAEPKSASMSVRICARVTIIVGVFAILDMTVRAFMHRL